MWEEEEIIESRMGYLTLEEMAYAHVRCASQFGLREQGISPEYFRGKGFLEVKKAIKFLSIKNGSRTELAEIVLCPNNHILRFSPEKQSRVIRCPKCKWEKEIWMHKSDRLEALIAMGIKNYNAGELSTALEKFREAQKISRTHSPAYCWASKCLKKQGKHQDAIRELTKLLAISPEDLMAQNEMKNLIYWFRVQRTSYLVSF